MEPFLGEECQEGPEPPDDICDECGSQMEWTLDLDGVQRRECPNCND